MTFNVQIYTTYQQLGDQSIIHPYDYFVACKRLATCYGQIYNILSSHKHYDVIVGNYPEFLLHILCHNINNLFGWMQIMGCNVGTCIISYRTWCIVDKLNNSFITPPRVGTRFILCGCKLKHVKTNDMIIRLHLHQFSCAYLICTIHMNICTKYNSPC